MSDAHVPVLFEEALDALDIRADGCYLDATFGRGGHSAGILERLGPQGRLLAIDRDPEAVAAGRERFAGDVRFAICQTSFARLDDCPADRLAGCDRFDGVLMDLGVSSPQLDQPQRGFSFRMEGPLDMRMDTTRGETAGQWLQQVSEKALAKVLKTYGEERYSKRVAAAIVRAARAGELESTTRLAEVIRAAIPGRGGDKDKATRSFQAIRIAVNREMEELENGLPGLVERLNQGGRLVVITFHSLEDRLVKQTFRRWSSGPQLPRKLPVPESAQRAPFRVVGKPLKASAAEVAANPRARSATLRVLERVA